MDRFEKVLKGLNDYMEKNNIRRPTYGYKQVDALEIARLVLTTMGGGETDPRVPRLKIMVNDALDMENAPQPEPEPVVEAPQPKRKRKQGKKGGRAKGNNPKKATATVRAYGEAVRAKLVDLIIQAGPGGATKLTLAEQVDMKPPAVLAHLKLLRADGLVRTTGYGVTLRYFVSNPTPSQEGKCEVPDPTPSQEGKCEVPDLVPAPIPDPTPRREGKCEVPIQGKVPIQGGGTHLL